MASSFPADEYCGPLKWPCHVSKMLLIAGLCFRKAIIHHISGNSCISSPSTFRTPKPKRFYRRDRQRQHHSCAETTNTSIPRLLIVMPVPDSILQSLMGLAASQQMKCGLPIPSLQHSCHMTISPILCYGSIYWPLLPMLFPVEMQESAYVTITCGGGNNQHSQHCWMLKRLTEATT